MICPICRKDTRTADQIICADCKTNNPYNLLGGYSTTKSISEELKKVGPYEEQIRRQKKLLRLSVIIIGILVLSLGLSLIIGHIKTAVPTSGVASNAKSLNTKLDSLEILLQENEVALHEQAEREGRINSTPAKNMDSIKAAFKTADSAYQSEIESLRSVNAAFEKEVSTLKAQVTALENRKPLILNTLGSTDSQIHVVKEGESLSAIALKYYGSERSYAKILSDNNITSADLIYVGQKLQIRQ